MFCQLGTHLALKSKWWEAVCSSLPPTRVYRLSLNTLSGGCPLVPGREWRGKQAMAAMFVGASFGTCFSVKALCDDCCKVEPCCCCGWNVDCLGECGSLPFFVCLFNKRCIWSPRKGELREKGAERGRGIFHPLVYFANGHHGQGWARQKPRTKSFLQMAHVGAGACRSLSWSVSSCRTLSDVAGHWVLPA